MGSPHSPAGPHVGAPTLCLLGEQSWLVRSATGGVPVLCASRYSMGYWGGMTPDAPVYYLPNPLEPRFRNEELRREIDVLVQARKSSDYVLEILLPRLRSAGLRVEMLSAPVDDMAVVLNQSKVFLYDSRDYWLKSGVSEGFGLPPLEALACGCHVFASSNAGLSDYIDPPLVGAKLGNYSAEYDTRRIVAACAREPPACLELLSQYRYEAIAARWRVISADLDEFFSWTKDRPLSVRHDSLSGPRIYCVRPRPDPEVCCRVSSTTS